MDEKHQKPKNHYPKPSIFNKSFQSSTQVVIALREPCTSLLLQLLVLCNSCCKLGIIKFSLGLGRTHLGLYLLCNNFSLEQTYDCVCLVMVYGKGKRDKGICIILTNEGT